MSQSLAEGVPVYDRGPNQNVGQRGLHTMYQKLTAALKTRNLMTGDSQTVQSKKHFKVAAR